MTALCAGLSHLDGLVGVDEPGTPTGELYASVIRLGAHEARGVSVPVRR